MKYAEQQIVEPGLKFTTLGGLSVETTGASLHVESTDVFVHEVIITEGVGEGNKYWHNLDTADAA